VGQDEPRDDEEEQKDGVDSQWFAMRRLALTQENKGS